MTAGAACPACGVLAPAGDRFCDHCGTSLAPAERTGAGDARCRACGAPVGSAQYCDACGAPVGSARGRRRLAAVAGGGLLVVGLVVAGLCVARLADRRRSTERDVTLVLQADTDVDAVLARSGVSETEVRRGSKPNEYVVRFASDPAKGTPADLLTDPAVLQVLPGATTLPGGPR